MTGAVLAFPREIERALSAFLLGVLLVSCGRDQMALPQLAVGRPVPAYSTRTLDGGTVRVGAGEPLTLVNLWATWCIPCRRELPTLEQLQRDYGARGLRILAVSLDEGGDGPLRQFMALRGVSFDVGVDDNHRALRAFQTVGLPESFLIDGHGILRYRQFGAIPPGAADLRATIDSVLAGTGPATKARPRQFK